MSLIRGLFLVFIIAHLDPIAAAPVEDCTSFTDTTIVGDDTNLCLYYVCPPPQNQVLGAEACPTGQGLPANFVGPLTEQVCSLKVFDCQARIQPKITARASVYTNYNIFGGTLQSSITNVDACITGCTADTTCLGLDFNFNNSKCYYHTSATECNLLFPLVGVTHYRLVSTSCVSKGFFSQFSGAHVFGGTKTANGITQDGCLQLCREDATCLAVDYNTLDMTCWFHGTTTYCNSLSTKTGCVHYKRAPCVNATNDLVAARSGFHILGGSALCTSCSVDTCLEMCAADTNCLGVDFDNRTSTTNCFSHTSATICNTIRAKDFCTQYRKTTCPITTTTTTTTTTAAATTVATTAATTAATTVTTPAATTVTTTVPPIAP